jgi:hypothetical protein
VSFAFRLLRQRSKNSHIHHNQGYSFSADVFSYPVISGNTLENNGGNGLEIRGGTLTASSPPVRNWSNTDLAYAVTGNLTIANGTTLVVDPGVTIKMGDSKLIGVNGVLKLVGTNDKRIVITSLRDDTVQGDTNGDGNASAPTPGKWGHISYLDPSVDSDNLIEFTEIRYGGYFDNGGNDYYNCWNCKMYGVVRFDMASPSVRSSILAFNQDGFWARAGSAPTLQNNILFGTTGYAAYNEDSSVELDARFNWWGHPSGPYHPTSNPGGKGDPVSDYVRYSPWNIFYPAMRAVIYPRTGGAVFSPDGSTSVLFAAGAVTEPTYVTYTVSSAGSLFQTGLNNTVQAEPIDLAETGHTFELSAATLGGEPVSPVGDLTIRFREDDLGQVGAKNTLRLYRWHQGSWVQIPSSINLTDNILTASITADGTYALLGQASSRLYLPLAIRRPGP